MLTIDVGNSRVKWVQFQSEAIATQGAFNYSDESFEECICDAGLPLDAEGVVISSVAGVSIQSMLTKHLIKLGYINYIYAATKENQCGVVNSYKKCSLLGVDRWLAMIAGFNHKKKKVGQAVCVIDCGTALTVDVIDRDGIHLGGVIAPGYMLMQSMLVKNTSNINEVVKAGFTEDVAFATTTSDAIRQGCAQLLAGGISSMVNRIAKKHIDTCCIVTGGDSGWVIDLLEIDVIHEPLLVNKGLLYVSVNS